MITQSLVVAILVCLAVAYLRIMRSGGGAIGSAERWLVALPVALFFGWITAATVVGAAQVLIYLGQSTVGLADAISGAILLLVGAFLASAAVLAGKGGPAQGSVTYAATVIWALVGIIANQYDASLLTTAVALLSASLVVLVLFHVLRRGRPRRSASRIPRPGSA